MLVGEGKFAFPFVGKPEPRLTRGFSLIFARIFRIIPSHRKPGGLLIDETRRRRLGRRASWFQVKSIGSRIFPTELGRFDLFVVCPVPIVIDFSFCLTFLWINHRNLISWIRGNSLPLSRVDVYSSLRHFSALLSFFFSFSPRGESNSRKQVTTCSKFSRLLLHLFARATNLFDLVSRPL